MYKSKVDFLDGNGTPAIPAFNFDEGLYQVGIKRPDEHLVYIYFEVREPFSVSYAHKDFFQAVFFPNPTTESIFDATMSTTASLEGVMEIFDGQGNKYYERLFHFVKDHHETHRIDPELNLPNGFLYVKMSFIDGSHKTYTILKQ